jgi:WD40 repeat protein
MALMRKASRLPDRPEIPLHTNGSENDIRCQVTKRKVSGGTRSDTGRDCRDAFLGLNKTCAKLNIAFWDYLGALQGHTGALNSAVFAPNGGRILTASGDGTARLWDRDGRPLATFQGHTGAVNSAVFGPDGGRILTASGDSTARLWDRDGEQLAILQGHTDTVRSAAFAPDGSRILTVSDMTARLWEAFPKTQTLIDRVKAEVPRCLTPKQRQGFFLAPTPPRWCAAMHKWPYDGATPAKPE